MCLIIVQNKDTALPDALIEGTYARNKDGIGVMWSEAGVLHYEKIIPTSAANALEFYRAATKDRDCAVHFRMRTHGRIDTENCHPYEVFGFEGEPEEGVHYDSQMPLLIMHNGVLHTGNHANDAYSDTWHYVRDYLRKLLAADPALAFTREFAEIIGKHIGNNRFVLMNHMGDTAIVNESQGVRYAGAWFSNTYAWDSTSYLYPERPKATWPPVKGGVTTYRSNERYDWTTGTWGQWKDDRTYTAPARQKTIEEIYEMDVDEIMTTLQDHTERPGVHRRQVRALLEEAGTTKAYKLIEDLLDGKVELETFRAILGNRRKMAAL